MFIDWWTGLPWYARYGVAVLLLAVAAVLFYFRTRGWIICGSVGLAMLFFAGRSEAEKRGYRSL